MKPSTTQTGTASSSWRPTHQRAILFVACTLAMTIVVFAGYRDYRRPAPVQIDAQATKGVEKQVSEAVARGLPKNATPEQKALYYQQVLYVLQKSGDNKKTADYYIKEVVPSKVELPRSVEENMIGVLLATNHRAEAKVIAKRMIKLYGQPAIGNEATKQLYATQLKYYTEMEANL